jgi:hypothetical protein
MSSTREQIKARLLKEAERVVDELLDWRDATAEPNLTQIEEIVLKLRKQFSEEMAREVMEAQEAKQLVSGPPCPKCEKEMRYKGQKAATPQTWVGDVKFKRGYYYCAACKVGFFPLGRTTAAEGQAPQRRGAERDGLAQWCGSQL